MASSSCLCLASPSSRVGGAPASRATPRHRVPSRVSFARGCALKGSTLQVQGLEFSASASELASRVERLSVRAEEATEAELPSEDLVVPKTKHRVLIKTPKRQRVSLRFLWLEKNIGIALDQVVPGHGTLPISPYFFWPRKDAWEELKTKLDSKKWISRKRTIILLNQATDVINLWQQNASNSL